MEQRPLRLGDIVDDYCPRERRITDHAVVAMIDDAIKQTRCTACDAEHPYKDGKAPRRKKTPATGRLYKEVLAGIKEADAGLASHDNSNDTPWTGATVEKKYRFEDLVRKDMCVQFGAKELDAFFAVKRAFDPGMLLNPNKAIPTLQRCAELGRMRVTGGALPFADLPRF